MEADKRVLEDYLPVGEAPIVHFRDGWRVLAIGHAKVSWDNNRISTSPPQERIITFICPQLRAGSHVFFAQDSFQICAAAQSLLVVLFR